MKDYQNHIKMGDYRSNVFGKIENSYSGVLGIKFHDIMENPEDEEMMSFAEEASFTSELLKNEEAGYTFKWSDFRSDKYDKTLYELFGALEKNEKLLKLIYKFYMAIK